MNTTTQLIPYTFDSHAIRSTMIADEPWFLAADVCNTLGYMNVSQTLSDHVDPEDKHIVSIGLPGSAPTFVNESGMYALIFGSHLESARRFKLWVTKEVLPAIRKTGAYGTTASSSAAIAALRRIHAEADKEIEHRTRHDFYRPDSARSQEHRAAVVAEVAHRLHLDESVVTMAYHQGVEAVMANVYGDPIAQSNLADQRTEQLRISQAHTVRPKRRSRRRAA